MTRRTASLIALGAAATSVIVSAPAQAAAHAGVVLAKARTYVGTSMSTPFGPVQVAARVRSGRVTAVTATLFPNRDPRSANISAYAIPRLQQQAMAAQSAAIDGVSGASWTSSAFARSLQAALAKAGIS